MANWKKVIVSGSDAVLNQVTASYFKGDGSALTGISGLISNDLVVDNATIKLNTGTTYDGSAERTLSIKDGGVDADALASAVAGDGLTGGGGTALAVGVGTGLDVAANAISVDVSDFMANGSDNRIVTATGADAMNAEANFTFNGSNLVLTGAMTSSGDISGSLASTGSFGMVKATSFQGDGSQITGVSATGLNIDAFGADGTSDTIVGADKFIFSDATVEKRATISQLATPLAGTNLEANSGTIRIASSAAGTGLSGGGASALAVDLSGESSVAIGAGTSTVTFGDDVKINGDLTIFGDTVQQQVSNLLVEDKFILLNSGSAAGDGGIIVQTNASFAGAALVFDDDINRWAVAAEDKVAQNATSIDATGAGFQMLVSVSGSAKDPIDGANPNDFGTGASSRIGMMHVNTTTGDIFIYS